MPYFYIYFLALQLDNKTRRFDDENVVLALFILYFVVCTPGQNSKWRIQKGTHGEKVET